jgi:BASS family bile acid:Na+ symporter
METLNTIPQIAIQGGLALLVFAVGLTARREDVFYVLRRPAGLGRAVIAITVAAPISTLLMVEWLPVSLPAKAAVVLTSLAALPPVAPQALLIAGARRSYAYGLSVTFALLAAVIIPATVGALNLLLGAPSGVSTVAVGRWAPPTLIFPLILGLLIHACWPDTSERISPAISAVTTAALCVIVVLLLVNVWPDIEPLVGNGAVFALAASSAAAIAVGHVLGGPDPRDRVTLATAAATRHPGVALLAASGVNDRSVAAMVLLYLFVSLAVVASYRRLVKRMEQARGHGAWRAHDGWDASRAGGAQRFGGR